MVPSSWLSCCSSDAGPRAVAFHFESTRKLSITWVFLKNPGQRVVVAGGHRVELVVVTPRTTERQSQGGSAERIDLVIDDVHLLLGRVVFGQHLRAECQEPGGDHPRVPIRGRLVRGRGNQVTGDLFDQKPVEWPVGVEAVNHPVAVSPGVGVVQVVVHAVAVGVANNIEPQPSVALAVARRGEQSVDQSCESPRSAIGQEGFDLTGRRREPVPPAGLLI